MTRALLISVKPRYARAILDGRKTVEVRRRFPSLPDGTVVVLYSSSPEKAILGTVRLRRTTRIDSNDVWRLYGPKLGIEKKTLYDYLSGAEESTLLEVDCPELWNAPVTLDSLRGLLGIEPPQSFRYLRADQVELVRTRGIGVESGSP